MNKFKFASTCLALLLLSSCGGKRVESVRFWAHSTSSARVNANLSLCEARWQDAPLPLDAVRDQKQSAEGDGGLSCLFVYTTRLKPADTKKFYESEMERLGWSELAHFDFPERLMLIYDKPFKSAVVEINSYGFQTTVRLFVGMKKGRT